MSTEKFFIYRVNLRANGTGKRTLIADRPTLYEAQGLVIQLALRPNMYYAVTDASQQQIVWQWGNEEAQHTKAITPKNMPAIDELPGVSIIDWSPGDAEAGDLFTQVHVLIPVPEFGAVMAMRLKSRAGLERFVADLLQHADQVWPQEAK